MTNRCTPIRLGTEDPSHAKPRFGREAHAAVSKQVWFLCLAVVIIDQGTGCKKRPPPPAPPPEVQVLIVQPRDVPIFKEWIGTLDGYVNAQIRAQVSGYLLRQDYKEGSQVKQGDLLFEIDPRPFQAVLDQANAKMAQDEAQRSRTQWMSSVMLHWPNRMPSASRNIMMPSNPISPLKPR